MTSRDQEENRDGGSVRERDKEWDRKMERPSEKGYGKRRGSGKITGCQR
jgi:hypothetical protein